ncbi:hypothetical protein [Aureispira anguillae]|uniref:Uncharacterized protein n=1 Tax=Aureispira anguillae TaxID=2864201 RepID=A0A916DVM6_9BACT|nr:hypothetical protein [Aureispira anguillae]BDS13887.1 hypothetical protein AsAng_0046500 [Aureispira anguillae]
MKNVLVALTLVAILFSACKPDDVTVDPVTVNLSKTTATEMGLAANDKHMMITVSNTTDQEATIQWERAETQAVTGWTYDVNGSTAASGTLTIPANSSKDVTLIVTPNGTVGVGIGTLKFYDSANQALTMKTFTYTLTTLSSYFRIAPQGFTSQSVRSNDPATDYHIWVVNDNTVPVDVNWARTNEATNPSTWQIAICTDATCYTPAIMNESMTVSPGDSVDFKATIDHQLTTGNGGTTPIFWVAADSVNSVLSQELTHEVTL